VASAFFPRPRVWEQVPQRVRLDSHGLLAVQVGRRVHRGGLGSFELIAYHFAKTEREPGMESNLLLTGDGTTPSRA